MSNYVQSTNFATKDALSSGDPLKIVKGTEINTEFNNIATAIATKADLSNVARAFVSFTGSDTPPTILGSSNVASVVRNSTGNFTITFTAAIQDANYVATIATSSQIKELLTTLAGSLTITNENQSFAAVNPTQVHVAIFR